MNYGVEKTNEFHSNLQSANAIRPSGLQYATVWRPHNSKMDWYIDYSAIYDQHHFEIYQQNACFKILNLSFQGQKQHLDQPKGQTRSA